MEISNDNGGAVKAPLFLKESKMELEELKLNVSRHYLIQLAMKFMGTPYVWGGSTPFGFDCSGFIIWVFQVFELLGSKDWTADQLSKMFEKTEIMTPGDLVFYGKERINHIGIYIGELNGTPMMISAAGGDSSTISIEKARLRNAKVKIKPVNYRSDFQFACNIGKKL